MKRREFLQISSSGLIAIPLTSGIPPDGDHVTVGVCASLNNASLAVRAGCDFLEEGVNGLLIPDKTDAEFQEMLVQVKRSALPVIRSFIYFLPGTMKVVGPDADHDAVIRYASIAFARAQKLNARYVVFGSGKSREVPPGFPHETAFDQMTRLCKHLARVAAKHKIILAVEQLNRDETNFLNTLSETGLLATRVNHRNFGMTLDIYHALRENDDLRLIERFRNYIVHCHIAEKDFRTPPGVKGDDFSPYFQTLKRIRYSGGISIECRWSDMEAELPVAVQTIREQYRSA